MKCVKRLSDEERVPTSFSNSEHAWNPSNHCVPVLGTITIPDSSDHIILVMRCMQPVLSVARFRPIGDSADHERSIRDAHFRYFGIIGAHCRSVILQGLQYVHLDGVAHRDCSTNNMIIDATVIYVPWRVSSDQCGKEVWLEWQSSSLFSYTLSSSLLAR
ncbi:hypothetical protein F5879DRAFT_536283 [Lentinula edodes]|nr:hypothetical protein F5879DRAFT_536283 [Lentinula edodes]